MKSLQRLRSCLSTSSPAAIRKNRSNFATLMTWLVFFLLDSAAAIMASDSSARWCREWAELPLTAVRFSWFSCLCKTIDPRQGTVADPVPAVPRRRGCRRGQQPLFMLFRTIASTTGSCAATLATSSATTPPEKPPSGSPRQSRNSARPTSSFTFLTGEQPAGGSRRGGSPDCSGDDRTQSASSLLHLDAVNVSQALFQTRVLLSGSACPAGAGQGCGEGPSATVNAIAGSALGSISRDWLFQRDLIDACAGVMVLSEVAKRPMMMSGADA